jgi:RNA polymerase sigma factor (sigma-70 family)
MADRRLSTALRRAVLLQDEPSDAQLLGQFLASRQEEAFAALLRRHGPAVLGVCRQVLRDPADAEDAFQATFLLLVRKAATLSEPSSVGSWLHGTAYRLAVQLRRQASRRREREARGPQRPAPAEPGHEAAWRELQAVLVEELARLPEKYRAPLVLCYLEGKTQEEAARQLSWPLGTVRGRVARARDLLRSRLARRGLALSPALLGIVLAAHTTEAAVPAPLAAATLRAATSLAAGAPTAPTRAAALAGGTLRPAGRWWATVGLVLLAGALALGGTILSPSRPPGDSRRSPGAGEVQPAPFEPLPPGARVRLGTAHLRHAGAVSALAFAGDGKALASVGEDRVVRVWDTPSGRELHRRRLDADVGPCVVGFLGNRAVAAGASTPDVRLQEVATGKVLHTLKGHSQRADALLLAPGGRWLVSVARRPEHRVRVWDTLSGKQVASFRAPAGGPELALTPDGRTLAVSGFRGRVHVWDVPSGQERRVLLGLERDKDGVLRGAVRDLALSPDGKVLAAATFGVPGGGVRRWDIDTGRELDKLDGGGPLAFRIGPRHSKILATGGQGGAVCLWDTATGRLRHRLAGQRTWAAALAFSPDGIVLATGGGGLRGDGTPLLWDNTDGTVRLWDTTTGRELPQSRGPRAEVVSVTLTRDARLVAAGGKDGTVRVWDVSPGRVGKPRHVLAAHRGTVHAVAFAPDGKWLASAGADGAVRLWDVVSGKEVRSLRQRGAVVRTVAFAPDGRLLASAGADRVVRLWEVATGREVGVLEGHRRGILALAFAPGGRLLASAGGQEAQPQELRHDGRPADNAIRLWDLPGRREARSFQGPRGDLGVVALAFSPDGKALAAGCCGGPLRVWEVVSGRQRFEVAGRGNGALAFAPDGRLLASTAPEGWSVDLWAARTGRRRGQLRGHQGAVYAVAFSAAGRVLATASQDSTVLLWDARFGKG